MKIIRPVEVETCCICGQQFDKIKLQEMNIGRKTEYFCPECYARGHNQINAKASTWRRSAKGKEVLSKQFKKK